MSGTITLVWTRAGVGDRWVARAGELAVACCYPKEETFPPGYPWFWMVFTGDPDEGPCMFAKTRDEAMDAATEAWAEWRVRPVETR